MWRKRAGNSEFRSHDPLPSSEQLALDPPSVRREVKLPLNIEFLGKPWSEPQLLELASAFEKARGPRTPPPGFGPIPGEP
jgi:hypothetical protein